MNYKLQFAELLPYWNVLLQGLIFTIVLTVVSTVAGIAVGTAGASAPHLRAGVARPHRCASMSS